MPVLKNKAEREQFLRDYKTWYKDECAIIFGITFYIYQFENNARVVVTECMIPGHDKLPLKETKPDVDLRYNLIIPETDYYNPFDSNSGHTPREFLTYNLKGIGISTIVDYMTKNKNAL